VTKTAFLVSYILPMLLIALWVKPMCKDILVPIVMSEGSFQIFRVCIVFGVSAFRFALLRLEVQNLLDVAGTSVYEVYKKPTKEFIEKTTTHLKAVATYSWAMAHQSLSNVLLPVFLCLLLLTKGQIWIPSPVAIETVTEIDRPAPMILDDDEFIGDTVIKGIIEPHRIVEKYYQEIVDYETKIAEISKNRTEPMTEEENSTVFTRLIDMNKEGLIHHLFFRDLGNLAIFWNSVIWVISSIFSLLYTRAFANTKWKTN